MNVTVENLAPCKKLVRIELDATAVDTVFATMEKSFQKEANIPGFRIGKAPIPMVIKKHGDAIKEEVKRKLIGDAYRDALKEKNIEVLGYPDIEEIQFARGQSLMFAATIETHPEFELPEYKGLPVKREAKEVTDADVAKALDLLREQRTDFAKVDRALATGDIAVVNYSGTSDGQPLTEIAPTAKGLTAQQGFWVEMKPDSFVPGFSEQVSRITRVSKLGETCKYRISANDPNDQLWVEVTIRAAGATSRRPCCTTASAKSNARTRTPGKTPNRSRSARSTPV